MRCNSLAVMPSFDSLASSAMREISTDSSETPLAGRIDTRAAPGYFSPARWQLLSNFEFLQREWSSNSFSKVGRKRWWFRLKRNGLTPILEINLLEEEWPPL
jgi:hypothetical protein